jgi:hypothetical protein
MDVKGLRPRWSAGACVLDRSNLKVASRYGLMIDQMTGTGSVDVHVQHQC